LRSCRLAYRTALCALSLAAVPCPRALAQSSPADDPGLAPAAAGPRPPPAVAAPAPPSPSPPPSPAAGPPPSPPAAVPPPPAAAPPPAWEVPEPIFKALVERVIVIQRRDGVQTGKLLSVEPTYLVVAIVPSGQVVMVPKRLIVAVRLFMPEAVAPAPAAAAEPAVRTVVDPERYFGLQIGIAPSLMLDFQYRHFYAFLNGSLLFPFISQSGFSNGSYGTYQLWDFMLGIGPTVRLSDQSRWHFDVLLLAGVFNWDTNGNGRGGQAWGPVGVGFGFHYTLENGFTLGFKVPLIGASFGDSSTPSESLGRFYLATLGGVPFMSLGYRF